MTEYPPPGWTGTPPSPPSPDYPTSNHPPARKRAWWKHPAVWAIAALLLGIGIGGAGAPKDAEVQQVSGGKAAPTVTATATVTSAAAAAKPAPTVTVTKATVKTVEKAPSSCLTAIEEAEAFAGHSSAFATLMQEWPDITLAAAQAGLAQDAGALEDVTEQMGANTEKVTKLTTKVSSTANKFNAAKEKCRAAG